MQQHRYSARVRLNGQHVYLGKWGSPEADAAYDEVIAAWLANQRQWPLPTLPIYSVEELGDRYAIWARSVYRKRDKPTRTAGRAADAMRWLYRAGLAQRPPDEFGPAALLRFREWMAGHPQQMWNRTTINLYVSVIVDLFRWGVEQELVRPEIWQALKAVRPLKRGRGVAAGMPPPREGGRVVSVPQGEVEASLKHAQPVVAAMVRLQLATGMRPCEVVSIRPRDLRPTSNPKVMAYHVSAEWNKTDHVDKPRVVLLGPGALKILKPWLPADPAEWCFRGAFSNGKRSGPHYTVWGYGHAIRKACDRAFTEANPPPRTDSPEWAGYQARLKAARWSPRQLRHNRATWIRELESLKAAGEQLGHSSASTTAGYVDPGPSAGAVDFAARHG